MIEKRICPPARAVLSDSPGIGSLNGLSGSGGNGVRCLGGLGGFGVSRLATAIVGHGDGHNRSGIGCCQQRRDNVGLQRVRHEHVRWQRARRLNLVRDVMVQQA